MLGGGSGMEYESYVDVFICELCAMYYLGNSIEKNRMKMRPQTEIG